MILSLLLHNLDCLGSHTSVPSLLQMKKQEHQRWDLTEDGQGVRADTRKAQGLLTLHPEGVCPLAPHSSAPLLGSLCLS